MQMPGRVFSSGSYRYGFNGKENDNDVKGTGNQQDYGLRIYDPRLGKFLSVDMLYKDYPELTPYQFASNTPIRAVDLDGGEMKDVLDFGWGPEYSRREDIRRRLAKRDGHEWLVAPAAIVTGGALVVLAAPIVTPVVTRLGIWGLNPANQQTVATLGTIGVGLMDPNPAGAPTADLPGPGDDVGRVAKAVSKKLFSSFKPIVERRRELAQAWGIAEKYIEFSKKVFTSTLNKGTELIQFRVSGSEGTIGNYFALPGTKPEDIGILATDVVETLSVKVVTSTKALISTHKKNLPYYKDGTTVLEGGGLQVFSRELKNNVEVKDKIQ